MTDSIKKLAEIFSKFPTVGSRTASRFVFYLVSLPKEKINELTFALNDLKNKIKLCSFCFNPHEAKSLLLCPICQSSSRNKNQLCIVEKEADLLSIEKTRKYNGLYFILGANFLSLRKLSSEKLRIRELMARINNAAKFGLPKINFSEIIIATNPTPEGKTIAVLTERALKNMQKTFNFKITHLAKGLPVGGELEYADEETLESAFEGRK